MTVDKNSQANPKKRKTKKILSIIVFELFIILILFGAYKLYIRLQEGELQTILPVQSDSQEDITPVVEDPVKELSAEELEAAAEQDRLKKEIEDRKNLIMQADQLALGYYYEEAIKLIQSYKGPEGDYKVYPILMTACDRLVAEKEALVLYGGSYDSMTQINHIFFHSLIADNSKAFDGDRMSKGYNLYMTTTLEFKNIIQKMYEEGYVLIRMTDIAKNITLEDGSTEYRANEIYLREGKKPFIISQDDVNYYEYMDGDGFASRIVVGEDGLPTCEMILTDGTTVTGPFDMVPILDAFVEEHPDFSYQGAKGLLAITGYEGVLGYRTNDPTSPTYAADKEAVKKVVQALKDDGWEFSSHSWGHLNMQTESLEMLKKDTLRWIEEVGSLVGPTDIYVFPFGADIEKTVGPYTNGKYKFLKEIGFNIFSGVYKEPWMHIKKDYVRMTRRPIDGQALIEYSARLTDLFRAEEILDPNRPARNW